ncbi:MAG: outer membrane beta-barrel protein [Flavobacteriaceae bacterium]|nr:outer membrane beta-barrel protein [Flavobacteriaceae bacterium]
MNYLKLFYHILFPSILFLGSLGYGQNTQRTNDPYREDQVYLGLSFLSIVRNQSDFFQKGVSSHFQIGIIRDLPLSANGKWAAGIGLGYSTAQFSSNLKRRSSSNTEKTAYELEREAGSSTIAHGFQSIEFPIELRWRNSSPTDYQFWRVHTGIKFLWNISAKSKFEHSKTNILNEVNRWSHELFVAFGYNTWNIYVSYEIKAVLTNLPIINMENSLQMNALKLGLIFFLL